MKRDDPSPPPLLVRFFRWFCHPSLHRNIEGDLFELYNDRNARRGKRIANFHFAVDVLLLFRPGIIRPMEGIKKLNNYGMFKNYLTIGWRNLWRNKGYSSINIGGLALGMTMTILIGLWLYDELTHDRNFEHHDRLAAVLQNQTFNGEIETWWAQSRQLAPELRNSYGSNFEYVVTSSWPGDHKLAVGDNSVMRTGLFMEPDAPAMFTFQMIAGTRDGLKDLNTVLLARTTALELFGTTDVVGKEIRMDDRVDVRVTGVYENFPVNGNFGGTAMISPFQLLEKLERFDERQVGWGNSWFRTFVLLSENVSLEQAAINIRGAKLKKVLGDDDRFKPALFLHPARDWYLRSDFNNGVSVGGNIEMVWLFGTIGLCVLLLACINFINLNTARSEKRAKEVGIRKAIGSARIQLIAQFFGESLQVVLLSFILAIILVQLSLPLFNSLAGKSLTILWTNPMFWMIAVGVTVSTGLIAGSYPALFLSSFRTVKVLKGVVLTGNSALPRKVLVVMQFTISVTLVIGTIVIFQQIRHGQNRPLGYNYDGLVLSPLRSKGISDHFDAFRNEMLATGAIDEVALSDIPITNTGTTNSGFDWEGKDPAMTEEFNTLRVSFEFGKMVGWTILEGRDFSRDFPADSTSFLLNESAVAYMGIKDPVGKVMRWNNNGEWRIIGIVKDLVTQSPYLQVRPMIFMVSRDFVSQVNFKISPGANAAEAIARVTPIFRKYDPANEFTYQFADVQQRQKFDYDFRIGKLALVMTVFAIIISCLGLFGLASYVAERRTREIGIRKVLGASVVNLWTMLSRDFVLLVVIASVAAVPLSLWLMNDWLSQFQYRTTVSWLLISIAIVGAIFITLATVSYQTIKASAANPVKSLRTE
jgi:ABC-type antimicrobial peptide transport system permease subunit